MQLSRAVWVRAYIVHCHWGQSSLSKGERSLLWPVSQLQEADLGKCYLFASTLLFSSVFSGNRKIEWALGFVYQGEYMWLLLMARRPRTFLLSPWESFFPLCFSQWKCPWRRKYILVFWRCSQVELELSLLWALQLENRLLGHSLFLAGSSCGAQWLKEVRERESPQRELNHCKTLLPCYTHQVRRGPISGKGRVKIGDTTLWAVWLEPRY